MSAAKITVVRVTHGYNVFVADAPVVRLRTGVYGFDVDRAGLKDVFGVVKIPRGARPWLFRHVDDVRRLVDKLERRTGPGRVVLDAVGFPL